jgi:hypothetical protein
MRRESGHLTTLHTLGGLALGIAIPFTALGGLAGDPLAQLARAAATQAAARAYGEARAEIAVSFGQDGQIRCASVVRSTGSRPSDAAAREAALQLAGLQPAGQVAGRTLVFRASFGTVATDLGTPAARPPADSMVAVGIG